VLQFHWGLPRSAFLNASIRQRPKMIALPVLGPPQVPVFRARWNGRLQFIVSTPAAFPGAAGPAADFSSSYGSRQHGVIFSRCSNQRLVK
jgi:hypothetical protein